MKRSFLGIAVLIMLVSGTILQASPLGVTVKGGTLGVGGDLTLNLGERVNLRGGINWADLTGTVSIDEADIDSDLDWMTVPLLLDWHPFASGFRISAGVVFNQNEVIFEGEVNESITFNGTDYSLDSLDGGITFEEIGGYAGIGYGDAVGEDGRWHFSVDIGVMFQGTPEVELSATASSSAFQSMLDNDVDAAVDTFLEDNDDKIAYLGFYPVISIGVSLSL